MINSINHKCKFSHKSNNSLPVFGASFVFMMILFFLLVFGKSVSAQSSAQADFFMGEGLYINKHYDQALEYYQSSYVNLITSQSNSDTLKKVLERLVTVTGYLNKTTLNKTYRTQLKSMFNQDSDSSAQKIPEVPTAPQSHNSYSFESSDSQNSSRVLSNYSSGDDSSFEPSDLKVQILLYYRSYEPHEQIRYLSIDEKNEFNANKEQLIEQVVLKAKQDFAAEKGYSIARFGSDNYKLLQIKEVKYRVYDSDWGRTFLDSECDDDDSRDFWDDY